MPQPKPPPKPPAGIPPPNCANAASVSRDAPAAIQTFVFIFMIVFLTVEVVNVGMKNIFQ
jgi:hypothetical protein